MQFVNPSARMLKDLPNVLKKTPDLVDVTVYATDLEEVWMTFCSGYHELAAAGGVVQDVRE